MGYDDRTLGRSFADRRSPRWTIGAGFACILLSYAVLYEYDDLCDGGRFNVGKFSKFEVSIRIIPLRGCCRLVVGCVPAVFANMRLRFGGG